MRYSMVITVVSMWHPDTESITNSKYNVVIIMIRSQNMLIDDLTQTGRKFDQFSPQKRRA